MIAERPASRGSQPIRPPSVVRPSAAHEAIARYLAHLGERGRSPNTVEAYGADLRQVAAVLSVGRPPCTAWADLTRAHLAVYAAHLRQRGYASASLARKIASARSFFAWLAEQGELARDPTAALRPPDAEPWRPRVLTPAELDAIVASPHEDERPEGRRDAAMLRLLRTSGCRITELVSLDVEDLDLAAGYVRLGDGVRSRDVPLEASTIAALAVYLSRARPLLRPASCPGRRPPDTRALFVNHVGERITRQGVWLRLRAHARAAGVSGVSPGALRHSCAVEMLRRHSDPRDVQLVLGHRAFATTHRYRALVPSVQPARP